nr:MAG TPA: hypothetical protein [Caudoviricetes sp.]
MPPGSHRPKPPPPGRVPRSRTSVRLCVLLRKSWRHLTRCAGACAAFSARTWRCRPALARCPAPAGRSSSPPHLY